MERTDDLQLKGLKLIQNPDTFCFGIDAVLLSDFAKAKKGDVSSKAASDYVTVAFDTQGISMNPDSQTIKRGDKVTKPADLVGIDEDYVFDGWWTTPNGDVTGRE